MKDNKVVALLSFSMAIYSAQLFADATALIAQVGEAVESLPLEPRELIGSSGEPSLEEEAGASAEPAKDLTEDGRRSAKPQTENLPIIDSALAAKINNKARLFNSESIRVIVYLDYLPHAAVFKQAVGARKKAVDSLERDRRALMKDLATQRGSAAGIDAQNYAATLSLSSAERQSLRELSRRNEALSAAIKQETSTQLKTLIGANQQPVIQSIAGMGGNVEFSTIAGNTIIATIPLSAVEHLATVPGVMRVVEDALMEGHLDAAAGSSMVDPVDTAQSGLWDNGKSGGIYTPATIDSGVDQLHPAMVNKTGRSNFCAVYLAAGATASTYLDSLTCDDFHGHGTHVAGIVGSYGSAGYSDNLGMSFGVEKMVHLKAGWRNTGGGASMFWSDMYFLVDLALYNSDQLTPSSTFNDDIDGFNLSYGGATTLDDTDGGRFWDSVISTVADTPVTISAGNSGPSNTTFYDPAVSYNAITVTNFDDRDTASRADDIIRSSSTRGPTANGRRKPDFAAPGSFISAPRHNWEGANNDFVNLTGTSMAAPMVLGVIMDLMDAGLFDELSLKAVLINSAQKNLAGMNIEGDLDGWHPQIGWGAMNAYAAYFHRFDTFTDSVNPRDTAGDYQLYKGSMRDEGPSGEGRDRATMVWNRVATYLTASTPNTYYNLVDLNLRLYNESNNNVIDEDVNGIDNVHQVRIGAGASDTDVIVKAYAWSTAYDHGGASQDYALATEDGFTSVDFPTAFQGLAISPTSVEPNEEFELEFWIRNDSEIASHNNNFELVLPAGWTLVAGDSVTDVGSAAGSGTDSSHYTWTVRAPATAAGAQNIIVQHTHSSYLEDYGPFNWDFDLAVILDTDDDGIPDTSDNCIELGNPEQRDTDNDGYGNFCDADLNNDGVVNLSDFSLFRAAFGQSPADEDADFNGDNDVNLSDFSIFRSQFGSVPGPSAPFHSP